MFLTRSFRLAKPNIRLTSTAVHELKLDDFRTFESNPTNHTEKHIGRYYTVNPEVTKQLFSNRGLPKKFVTQTKTFNETCIMIRQPAIELINYLNNTDYNKPVNRYVLYGDDGVGRSLVLAHLLHYGFVNDFIIVHVPWVADWFKKPKETANSELQKGLIDINIDAAAWLIRFKTQNAQILEKLNLKCSKQYIWTKREDTPADAPITELIEHGINRVKFATGAISALISELKQQSSDGRCKTMVAIDGYNSFFHTQTRIKNDNKLIAKPEEISITEPFLNITTHDWNNGVCLLVADRLSLTEDRMESYLPKYLLRRTGFEHIDPFIPIRVDDYSEEEFYNCLAYYRNRNWIQHDPDGLDKELDFISGRNPYTLMNVCSPL